MAQPRFYDRVLETCSAPGTGTVTLLGAVTGKRTFASVFSNSDRVWYCIEDQSGSNWEVGIGTYSAGTIARTAGDVVAGSAGAGTLVNFSAGTQNVFCDFSAYHANVVTANIPQMWLTRI